MDSANDNNQNKTIRCMIQNVVKKFDLFSLKLIDFQIKLSKLDGRIVMKNASIKCFDDLAIIKLFNIKQNY